jgi:hypothetical protein
MIWGKKKHEEGEEEGAPEIKQNLFLKKVDF